MKKSSKAALQSALIFPGAGHMGLDHYFRGSVLMLSSIVSAYVIVRNVVRRTLSLLESVEAGGAMEAGSLTDIVTSTAGAATGPAEKTAVVVLVICWFVGIIDSYRLGANAENKNSNSANT